MKIAVYVCPTIGCGNYYGTNGMPNLHEQFTGAKVEDRSALRDASGSPYRHSRAACPDCRSRGIKVERQLVNVHIATPAEEITTPALPVA